MKYNDIKKLVLHCTATPSFSDFHVVDIERWHKKRGFKCCGYHYVINLNGGIELGRPCNMTGAHAVRIGDKTNWFNKHSLGICYVGGLYDGKPMSTLTDYQECSMMYLIFALCDYFGLDFKRDVILHNEIANKSCPCFDRSYYDNLVELYLNNSDVRKNYPIWFKHTPIYKNLVTAFRREV